MTDDEAARYERAKLALLTNWPLAYIDALGMQDRLDILEIVEAEQKLQAATLRQQARG